MKQSMDDLIEELDELADNADALNGSELPPEQTITEKDVIALLSALKDQNNG